MPAFLFEKGRAAPLVLAAIVGARIALRFGPALVASLAHLLPFCVAPGVGILLPLALVVCYITRQSQYTSNTILQRTLHAFFYLTEQKNSLTTRHVQPRPSRILSRCADDMRTILEQQGAGHSHLRLGVSADARPTQ